MRRDPDSIATMAAELVRQTSTPVAERVSGLSAARELRGFRLADAAADVRGWVAIAADGRPAGRVSRLIVDTRTRQVRYLAVDLAARYDRRRRATANGTVLVPVGLVRRVDDICTVILDRLTTEVLSRAPRLAARPITRADEDATLAVYGMPTFRDRPDEPPYSGPLFDDSRLFTPAANPLPTS